MIKKVYASAFFIILSILAYLYLTNDYYKVKYSGPSGESICSINDTFNCEAVAASDYSSLFLGIPNAILGLVLVIVLMIALIFTLINQDHEEAGNKWFSFYFYLNFLNIGASILMAIIAFTAMDVYCLFCMSIYVFSAILFVLAFLLKPHFDLVSPLSLIKEKSFLTLGLLIPAVSLLLHNMIKSEYSPANMEAQSNLIFSSWKNGKEQSFTSLDPLFSINPDQSKVVITEFADFLCSHCASAHETFKSFLKLNKNVRLDFYTYPLDPECNPSFDPEMKGPGYSCTLSAGVYCAEKLGKKGKELYSEIFTNQNYYRRVASSEQNEGLINEMKKTLTDLDLASWETCVQDPVTKKYLNDSAILGKKAGVQGTPTVYLNNKKLDAGASYLILNQIHDRLK